MKFELSCVSNREVPLTTFFTFRDLIGATLSEQNDLILKVHFFYKNNESPKKRSCICCCGSKNNNSRDIHTVEMICKSLFEAKDWQQRFIRAANGFKYDD